MLLQFLLGISPPVYTHTFHWPIADPEVESSAKSPRMSIVISVSRFPLPPPAPYDRVPLAHGNVVMGLFGRNVLFSEVTGTLLRGGKPVSGVEVSRRINSNGVMQPPATTRTNPTGQFHFALATAPKRFVDLLPTEFAVGQEIVFSIDGHEILGWLHTRRDTLPNSESKGRPFVLICDLDAEEGNFGICRLAER